jgi:hypothetical protein
MMNSERGIDMQELIVPSLSWEDRYKRMLDIAYTLSITYKALLTEKYGEEETMALSGKVQGVWSGRCSKALIKMFDLKPTVEDAIKLMMLYSREVWGFGEDQYVGASLESPQKGIFINKVCRGWEKRKEFGGEHDMIPCHVGCGKEYTKLVHHLAPHLKVSVGKAYPKGDTCCEFFVEEVTRA